MSLAAYIDRVSEELVSAYEAEKENWLRNLSAARAARVRALLSGDRIDLESSEAILGYRLRQHHVGLVCWAGEADIGGGALARLERATSDLARRMGCAGRPIFLPQDESYAWAWLPLGAGRPSPSRPPAPVPPRRRPGSGSPSALPALAFAGFRRTHQQALAAYAVALAAGPSGRPLTSFAEVAPLALMSGSIDLVRPGSSRPSGRWRRRRPALHAA